MASSKMFFKLFFTNPYKRRICSKLRTVSLRSTPYPRLLFYTKHSIY
jgi:hypothetical protein